MRLKNTADNFSASFHITPPYQMVVIHSSKLIYPRELYQRGIQRKRVELIAKDFNEYTANEPKVSFRNGRYYVTDGSIPLKRVSCATVAKTSRFSARCIRV